MSTEVSAKVSGEPSALILFAHPFPNKSRINIYLLDIVKDLAKVTIHDLYETYPNGYIQIEKEQELLRKHQLIIFQHPLYWYSCPALLKEWMDVVLLQGFAFGSGGDELKGKDFLQVVSTGAPWTTYQREGAYRFTVAEILRPFEATVHLCRMRYHHPFLVQGIKNLSQAALHKRAQAYRQLLEKYLDRGSSALREFDSLSAQNTMEDLYL